MDLSDINQPLLNIKYTLSNYLDEELHGDPEDFVTNVVVTVFEEDQVEEEESGQIVECVLSHIKFQLATDYGYPLIDVMDASESILQMSKRLVHPTIDEGEEIASIEKIGGYDIIDLKGRVDILLLENMEITSAWRNFGIENKIIKNLAEHFYSACGLIVFPEYVLADIKGSSDDFELIELGFNRFDGEYLIATPTEILRKMSDEFSS